MRGGVESGTTRDLVCPKSAVKKGSGLLFCHAWAMHVVVGNVDGGKTQMNGTFQPTAQKLGSGVT